jgi:hypothetical protein
MDETLDALLILLKGQQVVPGFADRLSSRGQKDDLVGTFRKLALRKFKVLCCHINPVSLPRKTTGPVGAVNGDRAAS